MCARPPRRTLAAWPLLLALLVLGCPDDGDDDSAPGDDDSAPGDDDSAGDDDMADDDTSWGDPGAQAPPTLDALPGQTNAAVVDLGGSSAVGGSTIRVYAQHLSPPLELTAAGDGRFDVPVGLAVAQVNELYVTATADDLESEPAVAVVERCGPGDPLEVLGGDTCADAIDLGTLFDDGTQRSLTGNALEAGDEDWYRVLAADDYLQDVALGADDWRVRIAFSANDGDAFRMAVFKGGCDLAVCADQTEGYTEFTDDVEQTPCGGLYNVCADDTAAFWIRVTGDPDGSGCADYTLTITNG